MDKSVFGLDSRERMAFLSFAVPECSKARPEDSKTWPWCHFVEKGSTKGTGELMYGDMPFKMLHKEYHTTQQQQLEFWA